MCSNDTAMTMKAPTKAPCQKALIPRSPRLLRMTSISAEPTSAPNAVPTPPRDPAADDGRGDDLQFHARTQIGGHPPSHPVSMIPAMPAESAEII